VREGQAGEQVDDIAVGIVGADGGFIRSAHDSLLAMVRGKAVRLSSCELQDHNHRELKYP
jgi:pyrimidine operon attenuation protein/uracil phosphoribosyltransferase